MTLVNKKSKRVHRDPEPVLSLLFLNLESASAALQILADEIRANAQAEGEEARKASASD